MQRLFAIAVLLIAATTGCTSSETHYFAVAADGSVKETTESQRIGTSGGSLKVTDPSSPIFGAEIDVPAGALGQDTTITVAPASQPPAIPFGIRSVGPLVAFGPAAVTYALPATVILPYQVDASTTERLVLVRFKGGSSGGTRAAGWEIIASSQGMGRTLTGTTDQNGLFAVAAVDSTRPVPGTDGGPGMADVTSTGGDGSTSGGDVGPAPFDNHPPTFGGLVSAEVGSDATSAHLTWDAASDNVSPPSQIRYRIYLPSFATIGAPQSETAPGATSADLPVARGVTYYFLVRAVDHAGNVDSNLKILSLYVPPAGPIGKQLGEACQGNTDCQSAFCADGVCCESSCLTDCHACNGSRAGRCDPTAVGSDPRNQCAGQATSGTKLLCDAMAACTLCQPVGSTEICNDGVDNNGDMLVDGDDPACAACGVLPPPPRFCDPRFPYASAPATLAAAPSADATVGLVALPAGGGFAFGVNEFLSSVLPGVRLTDPVGSLTFDQALSQMPDSGGRNGNPQVVVAGGQLFVGYGLTLAQKPQLFLTRFDSIDAAGPMSTSFTPIDLPSGTFTDTIALVALPSGDIAAVYMVLGAANGTLTLFLQPIDHATGFAIGSPAQLDSVGMQEGGSNRPAVVDSGTGLLLAWAISGNLRLIRSGYDGSTPLVNATMTGAGNGFALSPLPGGALLLFDDVSSGSLRSQRVDTQANLQGTPQTIWPNLTFGRITVGVDPAGTGGLASWDGIDPATMNDTSFIARLDGAGAEAGTFNMGQFMGAPLPIATVPQPGIPTSFALLLQGSVVPFCGAPPTLLNDTCAQAIQLNDGIPCTSCPVFGPMHSSSVTAANDDGFGTCSLTGKDVFYRVTAPASLGIGNFVHVVAYPLGNQTITLSAALDCSASAACQVQQASATPGTPVAIDLYSTATDQPNDYLISVEAAGDFMIQASANNGD